MSVARKNEELMQGESNEEITTRTHQRMKQLLTAACLVQANRRAHPSSQSHCCLKSREMGTVERVSPPSPLNSC